MLVFKNHFFSVLFSITTALCTVSSISGCKHKSKSVPSEKETSLIRVADSMKQTGNYKTAYNFYEDVLDKNPKSLQAHLGLIDLALINKQPQEAFKQYQLAEKYVGPNQDLDYSLVKIYLAMNDRHSAHIHAKKLTESAPSAAKSWRLLAVTLDTNGNHEEAHQAYEKALELEPNNIKTKSNYGLSLAMSHQAEKAVGILKNVVLHPEATIKDRHNYALALTMNDQIEEANLVLSEDLSSEDRLQAISYMKSLVNK